jgi:hypothetical protein
VDEQLGDLAAMGLVGGHGKDHLDAADEFGARKRGQQDPATPVDLRKHALERRAGIIVRERRHVADRRASGNAVGEDGCQMIEEVMRHGAFQQPDLDVLGHRRRSGFREAGR